MRDHNIAPIWEASEHATGQYSPYLLPRNYDPPPDSAYGVNDAQEGAVAREILDRETNYCIAAGTAMIDHGADAIRMGDDYGLNECLMCT